MGMPSTYPDICRFPARRRGGIVYFSAFEPISLILLSLAMALKRPQVKTTQFGEVPNSWGDTELFRFIDHGRYNQITTFLHNRERVRALEEIDKILHEFAGNVSNIKGQFLAPMFTLRCHSAFRAASSLALAGHVAETFVIIRSILEYARYGLLISQDATLETLWASRHQDSDAPKK